MPSARSILLAVAGVTFSVLGVNAQDVPFTYNGAFEGATASSTDFNSGGTIRVSGHSVTVPKNLQIQFPAAWVGFKDFAGGSAAFDEYEVEVTDNIVGGTPIAAQISIAQYLLAGATGFVDTVSFDGRIKIKGGPTIRINDPNAVYSAGYTAQPFFTADDANPSITAFSGFPMCVPRKADDPLCPQSNRPTLTGGSKQGNFPAPDPLVMAPIVPGDYLEYSGIQVDGEIVVYNMVVSNVQITTTGVPTYIRMEDAIIGVFSSNGDQETAQIRFIGVTSDGSANVNPIKVYAMDVDPCTGKITDREVAATSMIAGSARNKFDYRVKATQTQEYTREYRIVAGTGTRKTKNGILAGQYVMPVSEWIQAEATTPGLAPFPNNYRSFPTLTKGLGYDDKNNLWGPLNPFPQSGVTVSDPTKCPPPATEEPPATGGGTTGGGTTGGGTTGGGTTGGGATTPPATTNDVVTMPTFTWVSSGGGTLTISCRSSSTDSKVAMKLSYTNRNGPTNGVTMTAGANGVWNYNARSIKQPTSVTCTSGLGGKVTRTS
ncbi:hypothetical protein BN1723_011942 [Verticillium longisporum]|uniref:Ig-like domain-containing protein n=1 Tax=Verticillium longisporum TaxID=100787 RepID=A0A0G4LD11_VERLO|nr:hypothetical protein HYQ44_004383 [Verticillium longisporum]CRK19615.1 hypothetical protein BN1723_011942 [Verticillium longisporum]CRK22623.1 hypothetical protein BN1708_003563 [Verticillium longisporum]